MFYLPSASPEAALSYRYNADVQYIVLELGVFFEPQLCLHTILNSNCRVLIGDACFSGSILGTIDSQGSDSVLKQLWHRSDAVICCSLKAIPHLIHPKTLKMLFFAVRVGLQF
jgi:hypothetical protein